MFDPYRRSSEPYARNHLYHVKVSETLPYAEQCFFDCETYPYAVLPLCAGSFEKAFKIVRDAFYTFSVQDKASSDGYIIDNRLFTENKDMLLKVFDIDRGGEKPRKDLVYAEQIFEFIKYFFDDHFVYESEWPAEVSAEDRREILRRYIEGYDPADDNQAWFEKIRGITADMGYAVKPKDFKKNPDMYKGHVGHVSGVIRIAVTGRASSPDLWTVQQIMGPDMVRSRIEKAMER